MSKIYDKKELSLLCWLVLISLIFLAEDNSKDSWCEYTYPHTMKTMGAIFNAKWDLHSCVCFYKLQI